MATDRVFLNAALWCMIAVLIAFIEPVYLASGQDPEVAALATAYVHRVFPFTFIESMGYCFGNFAMSQKVAHYPMITVMTGAAYHAVAVYVLFSVLGWGFYGVCWATGSMFLVRGLVQMLLVRCGGHFQAFGDVYLFSWETVSNVGPLLAIGLKSIAMGVWGWWAFDLFTLMASYLGPNEVATQTIMRSLGLLTFMVPVGFSAACRVHTGNSLGEGKPCQARTYYRVNLTCAVCATALTIALLHYCRD